MIRGCRAAIFSNVFTQLETPCNQPFSYTRGNGTIELLVGQFRNITHLYLPICELNSSCSRLLRQTPWWGGTRIDCGFPSWQLGLPIGYIN